VYVHTVSNE